MQAVNCGRKCTAHWTEVGSLLLELVYLCKYNDMYCHLIIVHYFHDVGAHHHKSSIAPPDLDIDDLI